MKPRNKNIPRAILAMVLVISSPIVIGFQNCGKGFQAFDASSTLKSTQQTTGTGVNTGSSGSTGGTGSDTGNSSGNNSGNTGGNTTPTYPYDPTPTPTATPPPATGGSTSSSRFTSLHQTPLRIATPPPAGSYDYGFEFRTGFKNQYAPTGLTGCAIGYSASGCAFAGGGSLALPEFTNYKLQSAEFKIYIPAGARSLMLSGYAPQGARAAFAMRFGAEPARQGALNDAEYSSAQVSERIDQSFANLVSNRTELLVVHDGGGTVRFVAGGIDASRTPISRGGWLYIRQINGTPLYDIQGGIDVDLAKYSAAYSAMVWLNTASPDPVD